jgi:hypothetical protein
LCSVLSSAENLVNANESLQFIDFSPVELATGGATLDAESSAAGVVPVAVYEVGIVDADDSHTLIENCYTGCELSLGRFISSETIQATIQTGDIVLDPRKHMAGTAVDGSSWFAEYYVTAVTPGRSQPAEENVSGFYLVRRVDLLFARLFVQAVAPVPHCFVPRSLGATADKHWRGSSHTEAECMQRMEHRILDIQPFWVRDRIM